MQKKLSFNHFALTLAALGTTTLTATATLASPITAQETQSALDGDTSALGEDKDADKDEKKKKTTKKDKKKKGGNEGGCGAGTCG